MNTYIQLVVTSGASGHRIDNSDIVEVCYSVLKWQTEQRYIIMHSM